MAKITSAGAFQHPVIENKIQQGFCVGLTCFGV